VCAFPVGDIHGDINKAMRCLELAGVAKFPNGIPIWTGGNTVVVQLGDILDRGDAEIATLMLLRQLGRQAEEQGGAMHILNGNHESLNVCGDFRCAFVSCWCSVGLRSVHTRLPAAPFEPPESSLARAGM
jgi:hypothetical protein